MERSKAEGVPLVEIGCRRFTKEGFASFTDVVAPEQALFLHWPGRNPIRLLAFPDSLDQLVLGHALIELCEPGQAPMLEARKDNVYFLAPTKDSRGAARPPDQSLDPEFVLTVMASFVARKGHWEDTGCFHRMAVLDPVTGSFVTMVEDIGRHNCIDRIAGWALMQGLDLSGLVLCASARATASLVEKAARAGFGCLISKSAVTTQGIRIAAEAGMTLIGFARANRFTAYVDGTRGIRVQGAGGLGAVNAECQGGLA